MTTHSSPPKHFFSGLFSLIILSLPLGLTAQPTAIFRVFFDLDQDVLTQEAETILLENAAKLDDPSAYRASLIGHTDQQGSLNYNQDLSERRAETVKAFLTAQGFNPENINFSGKAFFDPLVNEETESAFARNRRVDIIFEKADWNVAANYYNFSGKQAISLTDARSGTKIEIPEDAFQTAGGQAVEGEVIVMYREFRDFADFMASDLPMNFDNGDKGHYYFNSTGMFEMRAYSEEGSELSLRPGKEIDMQFVQTQIAPGSEVWRFNEETGSWQNGNDQLRFSKEVRKIRVPVDTFAQLLDSIRLGVYTDIAIKSDRFLEQLNTAYEQIPNIIASTAPYSNGYSPLLDGNSLRARYRGKEVAKYYAGTHYIGHLNFEKVYDNPKYYNIEACVLEEDSNTIVVQFRDISMENLEWAGLNEVSWKLRKRELKEAKFDVDHFQERFSDIRLVHNKRMRKFTIQLKKKGKIHRFPAQFNKIGGERTNKKERELVYRTYRKALLAKRKGYDQALTKKQNELNYFLVSIKLLLPKELELNSSWIPFLKKACYRYHIGWYPGHLKDYFGAYAGAHPLGVHGRSFLLDQKDFLNKHILHRTISKEEWITMLNNYKERTTYQAERFVTSYTELGNPVPNFRISGMGVFNLDVLKRFQEEKELMASFKDENGRLIKYARVEVINHRLNGLIRYKKDKIHLDLKSPTTLVVYGLSGKVYYIKAEELSRIDLRYKSAYAFNVKDLGDYKGNPSLLRNLLKYGKDS